MYKLSLIALNERDEPIHILKEPELIELRQEQAAAFDNRWHFKIVVAHDPKLLEVLKGAKRIYEHANPETKIIITSVDVASSPIEPEHLFIVIKAHISEVR